MGTYKHICAQERSKKEYNLVKKKRKEIQKTLERSITKEAIDEWGKREMLNVVP